MKRRIHLIIYGRVQGVLFRSNTRFHAKSLQLAGWVRNNLNGTVEIVAEGEEENLKELMRWCARGPHGASVEKVDTQWLPYKAEFSAFEVLR